MNLGEAIEKYLEYMGKQPDQEWDISLEEMGRLVFLGKVHAIEYVAEKPHLGDKKPQLYRHEFDKMPDLLSNGKELIVHGKIKITRRGIEG